MKIYIKKKWNEIKKEMKIKEIKQNNWISLLKRIKNKKKNFVEYVLAKKAKVMEKLLNYSIFNSTVHYGYRFINMSHMAPA